MTADSIQLAIFVAAVAAGMLTVLILGLRGRRDGHKHSTGDGITMILIAGGLSGSAALVVCIVVRALWW